MSDQSDFDFAQTHCFRCGKRLHNTIYCRDCGRITCSQLCHQKHACSEGRTGRKAEGTSLVTGCAGCGGCLVLLVFGILCAGIGGIHTPREGRSSPQTERAAEIQAPTPAGPNLAGQAEAAPATPAGRVGGTVQPVAANPRGKQVVKPGGTVHVDGYTRKNGTYVQPHVRSAPGSGGGRRR